MGRSLLGMVLAALIVSILALIVSTAAVLYNRQQARAARELAASTDAALRLDRSRRHNERMPHISPKIWQPADSGDDYQLDLLLDHKTPSGQLAEVHVVLTQFTDRDGNTYPADEIICSAGDQASVSFVVSRVSTRETGSILCTPPGGRRRTASLAHSGRAKRPSGACRSMSTRFGRRRCIWTLPAVARTAKNGS